MKALFKLFRRFDARRIFGFIRRLGGMSRPQVKCYDLRSTHALRVEGDLNISDLQMSYITFLSTPSGWRATTQVVAFVNDFVDFYPRPPGWRATSGGREERAHRFNFYPRPPGGGRPCNPGNPQHWFKFLSTPSGWRATELQDGQVMSLYISIHVLLTSILYYCSSIKSSVFSKKS